MPYRHHPRCVQGEHACECWCHFRSRPNVEDLAYMQRWWPKQKGQTMTTTKRPAKRRQRPTPDEQAQGEAVMRTIFALAKQAYLARQRYAAQGIEMAPIAYEQRVRQVLGLTDVDAPLVEVKKPGLVAATVAQAKRLLS